MKKLFNVLLMFMLITMYSCVQKQQPNVIVHEEPEPITETEFEVKITKVKGLSGSYYAYDARSLDGSTTVLNFESINKYSKNQRLVIKVEQYE